MLSLVFIETHETGVPCLGQGGADVLHVLYAADATVGDFTARQPDKVPKTPLAIEPAPRTWCGGLGEREVGEGERRRAERMREEKEGERKI